MKKKPKYTIVYLKLKPEYAKLYNLPGKLPILLEDLNEVIKKDKLDLEVILKGLEVQYKISKDDYYKSYLIYFYYEKFKKLLDENRFEEALNYLEKAKILGGEDYRYHFYKGLYLRKTNNLELAEIEYKESLGKNPNFELGYFELGNLMYEKNEKDEALKFYLKAHEQNPDFLLPLLKVADIYIEEGMLHESIEFLERCIRKDPNFVQPYVRLGVVFNLLQRFKDSVGIHKKALEMEPDNFDLNYNLAYALSRLGKHREALEYLKRALNMRKEDYVYHELAIEFRNLGLFEEAFEHEKKAYEIASKENKELITLSLMKFAVLIDAFSWIERLYKELENTKYALIAKFFYLTVLLIEGNEEKSFEIARILSQNGLFPFLESNLRNSEKIIDKLENFVDSEIKEMLLNSLDEKGYINSKVFDDYFENNNMRKGDIEEGIILLIQALNLAGFEYGLSERIATTFSINWWNDDGEVIAVSRLVLRYYQSKIYGKVQNLEDFIEEVIEEIKDLKWDLAYYISNYKDHLLSFEELKDHKIRNFKDVIDIILSFENVDYRKEELLEIKNTYVRKIGEWVGLLKELSMG